MAGRAAARRYETAEALHKGVSVWAKERCRWPTPYQLKVRAVVQYPARDAGKSRAAAGELTKALERYLKAVGDLPRGYCRDDAVEGKAAHLITEVREHRDRLGELALPRRQGRLMMLIDGLGVPRPGKKHPTLDHLAAAAVVAGLVDVQDFRSLAPRGGRRDRPNPTLTDGIEVVRKRVRRALESM